MNYKILIKLLVVMLTTLTLSAKPSTPDGVTLTQAKVLSAAVIKEAKEKGAKVAVAICDRTSSLVHLERMDGANIISSNLATGKAYTSAQFRMPTIRFEKAISGGRHSMETVPDFTPLMGGIPIYEGDVFIGSIGVCGADPEVDVALAVAALQSAQMKFIQN